MESREVISCHVTATSCELQPCRTSNVPKTLLVGLLLPLPGDFWSNDVSSRSLPVTWGHVKSFCHVIATSCELQPCRSSNVHKTWLIGLLQALPVDAGQMTSLPGHFWSRGVTIGHFLLRDGHLLRVTAL